MRDISKTKVLLSLEYLYDLIGLHGLANITRDVKIYKEKFADESWEDCFNAILVEDRLEIPESVLQNDSYHSNLLSKRNTNKLEYIPESSNYESYMYSLEDDPFFPENTNESQNNKLQINKEESIQQNFVKEEKKHEEMLLKNRREANSSQYEITRLISCEF